MINLNAKMIVADYHILPVNGTVSKIVHIKKKPAIVGPRHSQF